MAKGGYQKRRIEEKKRQEKLARHRAKRNKTIFTWLIVVVLLAVGGTTAALLLTGNKKSLVAKTTPTPTPSPTVSTSTSTSPTACHSPGTGDLGKKTFPAAPCMIINPSKRYTATMVTNHGTIVIDLLAKKAPTTVNNFVFLAQQGFYDNSIFHRVIPSFGGPGTDMIQGGDAANRDGTGDAGYKFKDENPAPFDAPGFMAMANSGASTNGSQFFLLNGKWSGGNAPGSCPAPSGCYSVFGQVTKGMDVIHAIANVPTDTTDPSKKDRPVTDVIITKVTIAES